MRITLTDVVDLHDVDDLTRFSVEIRGTDAQAAATLADTGLGLIEGEHAWISPAPLQRLAQGSATTPTWAQDFDAMVAYAAGKGWTHPTTGALRAHVERP